jgi:hypothetical protein
MTSSLRHIDASSGALLVESLTSPSGFSPPVCGTFVGGPLSSSSVCYPVALTISYYTGNMFLVVQGTGTIFISPAAPELLCPQTPELTALAAEADSWIGSAVATSADGSYVASTTVGRSTSEL